MAAISLAKALKLKNRLAGRLNKVQTDIALYNSTLKDNEKTVDVPELLKLRTQIVESMIELKVKLFQANNEIQRDLIQLGELKSELTWLGGLNTRSGVERHDYQNTNVEYVAILKKVDVDQRSKAIEKEIDTLQDKVDNYNYTKKIEIPDLVLNLGS